MGAFFFHMAGIFPELEHNLRAERQKIGIKRAMKKGVKFGSTLIAKYIKSEKMHIICRMKVFLLQCQLNLKNEVTFLIEILR